MEIPARDAGGELSDGSGAVGGGGAGYAGAAPFVKRVTGPISGAGAEEGEEDGYEDERGEKGEREEFHDDCFFLMMDLI